MRARFLLPCTALAAWFQCACTVAESVPFRCNQDSDCATGFGCNAEGTCEKHCCDRAASSSSFSGDSSTSSAANSSSSVASTSFQAGTSSSSSAEGTSSSGPASSTSASASSGPAPSSSVAGSSTSAPESSSSSAAGTSSSAAGTSSSAAGSSSAAASSSGASSSGESSSASLASSGPASSSSGAASSSSGFGCGTASECPADAPYCDESKWLCVECLLSSQCPADKPSCEAHRCMACATDADCNDHDPCTVDSCLGIRCEHTGATLAALLLPVSDGTGFMPNGVNVSPQHDKVQASCTTAGSASLITLGFMSFNTQELPANVALRSATLHACDVSTGPPYPTVSLYLSSFAVPPVFSPPLSMYLLAAPTPDATPSLLAVDIPVAVLNRSGLTQLVLSDMSCVPSTERDWALAAGPCGDSQSLDLEVKYCVSGL